MNPIHFALLGPLVIGAVIYASGCERLPVDALKLGSPELGRIDVNNPGALQSDVNRNQVGALSPSVLPSGSKAGSARRIV